MRYLAIAILSNFLLSAHLLAYKMQMEDIKIVRYTKNGISYTIKANSSFKDFDALKKYYRYFNRFAVIPKYDYIKDGVYCIKNFNLNFKKNYTIGNKLFFSKAKFYFNDYKIRAKFCDTTLSNTNILKCKNVKFFKSNKLEKTKVRYIFAIE